MIKIQINNKEWYNSLLKNMTIIAKEEVKQTYYKDDDIILEEKYFVSFKIDAYYIKEKNRDKRLFDEIMEQSCDKKIRIQEKTKNIDIKGIIVNNYFYENVTNLSYAWVLYLKKINNNDDDNDNKSVDDEMNLNIDI